MLSQQDSRLSWNGVLRTRPIRLRHPTSRLPPTIRLDSSSHSRPYGPAPRGRRPLLPLYSYKAKLGFILFLLTCSHWLLRLSDIHPSHILPLSYASERSLYSFDYWGDRAMLVRPWRLPRRYRVKQRWTTRQRSLMPVPELRGGPRLESFAKPCMDPSADNVTKLYVGVFSTPGRSQRRELLRRIEKPQGHASEGNELEFRFILGQPKTEAEEALLKTEMLEHQDIVLLDQKENMNNGKTHAFFRYLANREEPMPEYVWKVDDDTLLFLPNLLALLEDLDCESNYYMGSCSDYTCGLQRGLPQFFTGMAYGLSGQLVSWLGSANITERQLRGHEDVRTAQLLLNLDHSRPEERLRRINLDDRMGDWRYWNGTERVFDAKSTIAIHGMKDEVDLQRIYEKMQ